VTRWDDPDMMGHEHRLLAGSAWLAGSVTLALPWWQVVVGVPLAVAAANVPDVDDTRWWRKVDRALPDEDLGGCGPLNHRGLMHWWGLPAAIALALSLGASTDPNRLVTVLMVCAWAAVTGWGSHVVGDFVFGQRGRGVPRGVPLAPWGVHVGLGFDATGGLAAVTARLAPLAALIWCAVTVTGWRLPA
jgi:hypothetical protein